MIIGFQKVFIVEGDDDDGDDKCGDRLNYCLKRKC